MLNWTAAAAAAAVVADVSFVRSRLDSAYFYFLARPASIFAAVFMTQQR